MQVRRPVPEGVVTPDTLSRTKKRHEPKGWFDSGYLAQKTKLRKDALKVIQPVDTEVLRNPLPHLTTAPDVVYETDEELVLYGLMQISRLS